MPLIAPLAAAALLGQSAEIKVTFETTRKKASWYESTLKTPKYSGAGALGTFAANTIKNAAIKDRDKFISEYKPDEAPENPYSYEWATVPSLAKPTLISTYTQLYSYAGGAHPNHWYVSHTFGLVNGKPKQLKFSDLMRTKIVPKAVVSGVVIPRLKAMGASGVVDGDITEVPDRNVDNFVVTPAGITWIFSPYDVGAYVEGDFFVKVPWSDLTQHLNPNGHLKGIMPVPKS